MLIIAKKNAKINKWGHGSPSKRTKKMILGHIRIYLLLVFNRWKIKIHAIWAKLLI
jgi:hypothetical protein